MKTTEAPKHTPGPWTSKATASLGPQYVVYAENDTQGADIAIVHDHGNTEANARLIAAAPELLEALETCSNSLLWIAQEAEVRAGVPKAIIRGARHHATQARAVISKAKGKE